MTIYVEDVKLYLFNPASIVIYVVAGMIFYMLFIQAPAIEENMNERELELDFVRNADCTQLQNFINEEIKTGEHYQKPANMARELFEVNCK